MLSHERVWASIDSLALHHGLSASGLARRSGLDATSFNKSKRLSPEGRQRWPSTESISKILKATGSTLEDFLRLIEPSGSLRRSMIPMIGIEEAKSAEAFTDFGMPTKGSSWDEIEFPDFGQERVFALEITGDSLRPLYRDGDILIVSPTASTRRGDRMIVCTRGGQIFAHELRRRSATILEMTSLANSQEDVIISAEEVSWAARIMWARQ